MNIYFRGKAVGKIEGDTYVVQKKPEHYMIKYRGFGVSVEVLNDLKSKGIKKIRMIYHGTNGEIIFQFPVEDYLNSPLSFTDRDNDVQKFLKALSYELKTQEVK